MSVLHILWGKTGCCKSTHQPYGSFTDELLATHLWHILAQLCAKHCHTEQCNNLSVKSQLQGRRLRWLGHVFQLPLYTKLAWDTVAEQHGWRLGSMFTEHVHRAISILCCRIQLW